NTKLPTLLSDGFVADDDPTLCHEVFHISEAQAKSVVEPNSMADDIRRKSVSAIAGCVGFHPLSLLGSRELDNTTRRRRTLVPRESTAPTTALGRDSHRYGYTRDTSIF